MACGKQTHKGDKLEPISIDVLVVEGKRQDVHEERGHWGEGGKRRGAERREQVARGEEKKSVRGEGR